MNNIITVEEYKTAKGMNKSDSDEILQSLITNVSAIIYSYIGKRLVNDGTILEDVISLDYDTREIYLEEYPVSELVSVTELDPYGYDSTVHFPVSDSAYILDAAKGRLLRTVHKGYWPQGFGAIKVRYKAGHDLIENAQYLAPLKQAAIDLVSYYFKEEYKDKAMRGASMNNFASSTKEAAGFPPHIQRVLDIYK